MTLRLLGNFLAISCLAFALGWWVAWEVAWNDGFKWGRESAEVDDEERRADLDEERMREAGTSEA